MVGRISDLIDLINCFETWCEWSVPASMELLYLIPFYRPSLTCINYADEDTRHLLNRIHILITTATEGLRSLFNKSPEISRAGIDSFASEILDDFEPLKRHMFKYTGHLSIPLDVDHASAVGHIKSFIDNLVPLLNKSSMKEEIEVHVQFLEEFMFFVLNHCNDNTDEYCNFWDHVKYVANKVAGCYHFLRFHDAVVDAMDVDFMGRMLLDLLGSLKPTKSGIAKVYVGVLKALKSEIEYTHALDVLAVRFVDLFLHDLILKLKLNSKGYLSYYRDPVYQLHKALRFLLEFIFCKKPQHMQQLGDVNKLFRILEAVFNKLGSLVNSLDNGDDMNEDPDHLISNLLIFMTPITSQIRRTGGAA